MAHYGFDAEETLLAKQAYRNDPQAARQTYTALWREIEGLASGHPNRHADMAAGINQRIRERHDPG